MRHIHAESKENEQTDSSSTEEDVFTIGNDTCKLNVPVASIEVNNVKVQMKIDTGASTNIINESTYQLVRQTNPVQLEPDLCQIFAYGSKSQLESLVKFTATVSAKDKQIATTFHVLSGAHGSLLSYSTTRDLGLINISLNNITTTDVTLEKSIKKYPMVFQDIGKLKNYEESYA